MYKVLLLWFSFLLLSCSSDDKIVTIKKEEKAPDVLSKVSDESKNIAKRYLDNNQDTSARNDKMISNQRITLEDVDQVKNFDYDLYTREKFANKLITVNVPEHIPVKRAISEIAKMAGVDVDIDSRVSGSVILSLQNKNVYDVFRRIAAMNDLKLSVNDKVFKFEPDLPYSVTYTLGFLDIKRSGTTSYNLSTSVDSKGASGTSDAISSTNESSLWGSFEEGLRSIISDHEEVHYSINKQSGIITVIASSKVHEELNTYIEKVKQFATTQVLIEVKLVEVILSDEYKSGIKFNFNDSVTSVSSAFGSPASPSVISNAGSSSPFVYSIKSLIGTSKDPNNKLDAAVEFLERFGTTKTISSPRLNVINNQQSVLSFAKNHVYFEVKPQLQNQYIGGGIAGQNGNISNPSIPIIVNSTMKTVPVGVILSLQAVANPETGDITMSIRPSISSIKSEVDDPAAQYLTSSLPASSSAVITNKVPIIEKKELDSVLKIKTGEVMVLGGFNEERTAEIRTGIPGLKNTPILGFFFGQNQKYVQNIETVIFIKATIIPPDGGIMIKDREFYNKFVTI